MIESGPAGDILSLLVRYAHLLAAVAWVGGAMFLQSTFRPALLDLAPEKRSILGRLVGRRFGETVGVSLVVLIVSGAILTFERLTGGLVGPLYAGLLALKVALSLAMGFLAWRLSSRRSPVQTGSPLTPGPSQSRAGQIVLGLGLTVLLLALVLRAIFEAALRSPA